MTRSQINFTSAAGAIGLAAFLTGCAGPERPVEELSRARTLIEQADQAGAQEFAGADLQRAREQLHQADLADKKKEGEDAKRLAIQAAADAELAIAKTRQGKAEEAAKEVSTGTDVLKQESDRSADQAEKQVEYNKPK